MAPRAAMAPRLSKGSKAVRHLQHLFMSGILDGSEDPKTVYEAHTVFQQHKLANFRTCYNNMKEEYGWTHQGKLTYEMFSFSSTDISTVSVEQEDNGLNHKCTVEGDGQLSKLRKISNKATVTQDLEELETTLGSKNDSLTFTPLYLVSKWIEPGSMTKRMTLAIVLPSGIGAGNFSFRVLEGGEVLELTVSWPKALSARSLLDTSIMHKKWLPDEKVGRMGSIEKYHPKVASSNPTTVVGFEEALQDLRTRCNETVKSTASIPLDFPVETHIHAKFNLTWRDGATRMLYIELRAVLSEYALVHDLDSFELS